MAETYVCGRCKGVFEKGTPEADAVAEYEQYFGLFRAEEAATVCDDCWNKMHPDHHPHKVEQSVAETLRERLHRQGG